MKNRIKQVRKERKETLQQVADAVGLSNGTIANYENGKREPKLETWVKLANHWGVPTAYLQGITNDDQTNAFESSTSDSDWSAAFARIIDSEIKKGADGYDVLSAFLLNNEQQATVDDLNDVDKDDIYNYIKSLFRYLTFESIHGNHQTLNELKDMVKVRRHLDYKGYDRQEWSEWVNGTKKDANQSDDV
ncbi:helix-turn-helix domain-containing protein [Weissella confusa]|uniref:helix-turn-helix domain-containing protein n=1 Tax=Weissella confusa TaxID=1583 RepID=UPI00107F62CA|nr:helix-turn-helix transcriptional regulator [Weissella confusa]MBJ7655443.1 helix-turn-helix transcriptional regulator [Weissella confusa]TGE45089.1 hypothetical protein C6P25_02195 [Weissella confusa]